MLSLKIIEKNFNEFVVHISGENNCFVHVNINDEKIFYKKFFQYFFDEKRLLNYIENKTSTIFNPTKGNYAQLYKTLRIFIDKENIISFPSDIEEEILNIIADEYSIIEKDGEKMIRLDKMGKIGEYIFSNILSEYFGYQCIIPKLNMLTDFNMNIYGIDVLFYSPQEKLLLLGESKVCKDVKNGISMVNKSLTNYKTQIDDEFILIFSNRLLKDKMGQFGKDFGSKIEISLTMTEFVKRADIKKIGIPIFVAHGGTKSVQDIFEEFKNVKKITLYGIEPQYIFISLPLIDKTELMKSFMIAIKERIDQYESWAR